MGLRGKLKNWYVPWKGKEVQAGKEHTVKPAKAAETGGIGVNEGEREHAGPGPEEHRAKGQ